MPLQRNAPHALANHTSLINLDKAKKVEEASSALAPAREDDDSLEVGIFDQLATAGERQVHCFLLKVHAIARVLLAAFVAANINWMAYTVLAVVLHLPALDDRQRTHKFLCRACGCKRPRRASVSARKIAAKVCTDGGRDKAQDGLQAKGGKLRRLQWRAL